MESTVENSERSLLEWRKGYQIRLDEIKRLWKRRSGDYSRRRSHRDHAPTRRRRTPTMHPEDEKDLEAELETLKAQGSFDVKLENREVRSTIEEDELEMTVMKNLETEMEDKIQKKEDEGKGRERSITNVSVTVAEPEKRFEGDDDEGPRKQGSVPETDPHCRGVAPLQSNQIGATDRPNHYHRDAVVQPQSDLEPPKPLEAKTREEISGNRHVPPPEPPDPPDRGSQVAKVGISHDLGVLLLLAAEERNADGKKKTAREEWKLGGVDHIFDLVGQAQTSVVNYGIDCAKGEARSDLKQHGGPKLKTEYWAQFTIKGKTFQEEREILCGLHRIVQIASETEGGHFLSFITEAFREPIRYKVPNLIHPLEFSKLHEIGQTIELMGKWDMISQRDALKPLSPIFKSEEIYVYAVSVLARKDEEVSHLGIEKNHLENARWGSGPDLIHTLAIKFGFSAESMENCKDSFEEVVSEMHRFASRGKLPTATFITGVMGLFEVAEFTAEVKYNKLEHSQLLFLKLHGVGRNIHEFHGGKPALYVEIQTHKLQQVWGFSPTHFKQWDPGGNYYESSISWSLCFKQWDPGVRFFVVRFIYLHLEDKVSFEGAGIDANPLHQAQMSSGAQGVRRENE